MSGVGHQPGGNGLFQGSSFPGSSLHPGGIGPTGSSSFITGGRCLYSSLALMLLLISSKACVYFAGPTPSSMFQGSGFSKAWSTQ